MAFQNGLNIVTLIMCIVTLTMATAALVPQIKQGLVMLRDGLLWAMLLGLVGMVGFVGWGRLHDVRQRQLEDTKPTHYETQVEPIAISADQAAPDLVVDSSVNANQSWLDKRNRNAAPVNGAVDRGPR